MPARQINIIKVLAKHILRVFIRKTKKVDWYNFRSLSPISTIFALDRGTPIDRVYIDDFLFLNSKYIKGTTCEISENKYCKKYGQNVDKFEVLHYTKGNKESTIVGDLTDLKTIPENKIDCFVLTQTLNFIYDFQSAIVGIHHMLNNGGVALVTVSGISQISRYDMDRWGDYWRFTDLSIKLAFEKVFGSNNVEIEVYGNVLSAMSFLQGISSEELNNDELFYRDNDYQVTIGIKAIKK